MEKGYHQRASLASIRLQVCTRQTHQTLTTLTQTSTTENHCLPKCIVFQTLCILLSIQPFQGRVCTSNPSNPSFIYHWLERKSSHYLPRLEILARLERVFTLSTSAWKRAFTFYLPRLEILARLEKVFKLSTFNLIKSPHSQHWLEWSSYTHPKLKSIDLQYM